LSFRKITLVKVELSKFELTVAIDSTGGAAIALRKKKGWGGGVSKFYNNLSKTSFLLHFSMILHSKNKVNETEVTLQIAMRVFKIMCSPALISKLNKQLFNLPSFSSQKCIVNLVYLNYNLHQLLSIYDVSL